MNVINQKIQDVMLSNDYTKITELIDMCLKPREVEKKKFGEVFTPSTLINEMLDNLVIYVPDIFSQSDYKWLDPANGTGNFPILIYGRLMNGLKEKIPNEEERRRHILEDMIYTCELNQINNEIYKIRFGDGRYKLNVYEGDFLEFSPKETFDVIIGNPPYQQVDGSGDNKLYLYFTKKATNLLNDAKHLMFITPKNIMNYIFHQKKNRNIIDKSFFIQYLNIDTPKKYFKNVGSNFCYFILENTILEEYNVDIEYIDLNKVSKTNYYYIKGKEVPFNTFNPLFESILHKMTTGDTFGFKTMKTEKNKELRIRKTQVSKRIVMKKRIEKFIYPVIDKLNKNYPSGLLYYYDKKMKDMNSKKIIVSKVGHLYPTFDCETCISDNLLYMIIDSKLSHESFLSIVNSQLFTRMCKLYVNSGMDEWKFLLKLSKLPLNKIYTDEELYLFYGMTKEEQDFIKETKQNF
jgi:hypothetical protein